MSGRRGIPAGIALAAFAVLLIAATALASSWYEPTGWTNGTVLCEFGSASPEVAVSALSVPESGISTWLVGLSELHANGSVAGTADLSGVSWSVENRSNDDAYVLAFTAEAPIERGSEPVGSGGSVELSLSFVLPAYDGSPLGPVDEVAVLFAENGWTWQGSGDHLVLALAAAPSFPTSSHVAASTESGWTLVGQSNATGAEQERLGFDARANVTEPNGSTNSLAASTSLDLVAAQSATVAVSFATSAGEYANLSFDGRVGVVLPTTVAGIPLPELVAAVGAGGLVSLLVAVGARRVRRRPSRLVYADEEA
jgi:hypothetical protein